MKMSTIFARARAHLKAPGKQPNDGVRRSRYLCRALALAQNKHWILLFSGASGIAVQHGADLAVIERHFYRDGKRAYLARLMFLDLMARVLREEGL